MKEHEQQKLLVDEATKLGPIVEENGKTIEKSSSGQALLVKESEHPPKRERHVTIVDYCTNGAGELSSTVGMKWMFANCAMAALLYCRTIPDCH